jgi:hypothetical protein
MLNFRKKEGTTMKPFFLPGRFNKFSYFVCGIAIVVFLGQPAFGGKLEDFEQDVVEEREEKTPPTDYEVEDEEEPGFFDSLFGAIFRGVFEGMFGDDDEQELIYPESSRGELKDVSRNRA